MSTASDPSQQQQPPPPLNPPLATPCGSVAGRAFVITGGTQGLGLAVARQLLQAGAVGLILVSRSPEKGAQAVAELTDLSKQQQQQQQQSHCQIEFLQADLSDATDTSSIVPRAVALLHNKFISGLVNCAATTERGNLFTETAAGFDRHMAVNVRAPFLLTKAVAQHMIYYHSLSVTSSSSSSSCSIVNVISCAAYGGAPFITAYSASKAALVALTKCNAAELAPHGIRVNGVNLGWCCTDNEDALQTRRQSSDRDWIQRADASVPLGRILRPQDAAVTIVFLLSDSACMTTGTVAELHPEFAHGMLSLADTEDGR